VQPVKSGDFSFGKIFFIKEMLRKTSVRLKRGLPIGLMFLTLVLIALMILLSQYPEYYWSYGGNFSQL
jgi:hypothetical protein